MYLVTLLSCMLFVLGMVEKRKHQRKVDSIPIRINVNGIRGKSTITRLITWAIMEDGYKAVGKTTGTSARMFYWNREEEEPIIRRREGANIKEQKNIVKKASDVGAEVLVSECMAVNPDYQRVFQKDLLQANIGVIINVLEDHMDVLGPTLDNVAESFTHTIPYNGTLIIEKNEYENYYKEIAKQRNTRVIVADESRVSEEYLLKFEYMVFPINVAIALAVAEALNIEEEVALRGMLKANPDVGALKIIPIGNPMTPSYFVNGFAANDSASTLNIYNRVRMLGYYPDKLVVIMNCRSDRVDRTESFATDVLPHLDMEALFLIGQTTKPIIDSYQEGNINVENLYNLEGIETREIMENLEDYLHDHTIYGIGNIHGSGEPLIEELEALKVEEKVNMKDYQINDDEMVMEEEKELVLN
ncbi:poly-gamma-glutamate synthase PgsB [Oceanobacillus senegalensis]|uniref:poly-gamma-glutamate synthase PgsB n=1 Tax=Oceanobacillus senegalensis TaxID=1936063 RepID=UPI000A3102C9|nr:poly-gamma-glutamate synthase PgsB [Oceanobacillus senegalensis]